MAQLEAALREIESLPPGESINYTKVSKKYDVSRSTLSRRHRGVQHSKDDQYEKQRVLDKQHEEALIKHVNELTVRGVVVSHDLLRDLAREMTGERPGKHWPGRFMQRHKDELVIATSNLNNNTTATDSVL